MWIWLVLLALTCANGWAAEGDTMETPESYLADQSIEVSERGGKWVISGKSRVVTLDPAGLRTSIQAGPIEWRMMEATSDDVTLSTRGETFNAGLASASQTEIEAYSRGTARGLRIRLSGFRHIDRDLDAALQLFVLLEGSTEELLMEAVPDEGETVFQSIRWPRPIEPTSVDSTVIPLMQGMIVPRDWPKKVWLYDTVTNGRVYMPWWGHISGKSAAIMILETPDDAGWVMDHPEGGPTMMGVNWLNSLGRMSYPRRARMAFFESGDHVTLAKRYRRQVIENGHFVSLKEKIARSPLVGRLIGAPVIHTSVLYHIQPESSYYSRDNPAQNHQLITFDKRAEELTALAERGLSRAYVHVDGWGYRGYDNLHPDILPPSPEAGGWDGMRRLADACDRLGYVFAVHDQYRDYYVDAASYDNRHTVLDGGGNRPFHSTWYGGKQSILCSSLAPRFVSRNHRAVHEAGVKLRGSYLDVFAVVPPDECYSPEHPVTRTQCLRFRADCLALVREIDGVVSSEEPADWAIPHIDLVHHAPHALDPNPGGGEAMGIPAPLFNLVYSDALLVPYYPGVAKGGWGIPRTDSAFLHAIVNAGMPYIGEEAGKDEIERLRTVCALNKRVALLEMTGHEFIDGSHRKWRTTFADGTTVTVDFDSGDYAISPELSAEEIKAVY